MIFSTIKGYPDYIVTSEGDIYSLKYRIPRKLKPHINRGGYVRVGLCKDGKQKLLLLHRIVAETFISNPYNKPYVNHKDENKQNNDVSNLEWCTSSENNNYGSRLIRIAESNKKKIVQADLTGNILRIWDSQTDAAKVLGLDKRNINACLKKRRRVCGGYSWRYLYVETGKKVTR